MEPYDKTLPREPHGKTLTRTIALEWDGNKSLREYSSIDEDAAELLATFNDADLELSGLNSLSPSAACALSRQKSGSINLSGLTSLETGVAEAFANYGGHLGLEGLSSLSVAETQALCKSAQYLDLSGVASLSEPLADVLSKCKCKINLRGLTDLTHSGLAAKLVAQNEELDFPRLTKLSQSVATALSNSQSALYLNSLKCITNFDLAWRLFLEQRDSDPLSSLISLSFAEASVISNYKGDVYLENLNELSDDAAGPLSAHVGVLGLRGLKSLTEKAAKALSEHRGTLILPGTTSKIVRNHFLARFLGESFNAHSPSSRDKPIRAFELEPGKMYECVFDSAHGGQENVNILQLAIDANTNRRFVLFEARNIWQKDAEFVRRLLDLDFYFLLNREYDNSKWEAREMLLHEKGTILEDEAGDSCLCEFREASFI